MRMNVLKTKTIFPTNPIARRPVLERLVVFEIVTVVALRNAGAVLSGARSVVIKRAEADCALSSLSQWARR